MFPIRAHSLSANQYLYFDGDDLPIHQKVSCFLWEARYISTVRLRVKKAEIRKCLITEYVNNKINTINEALNRDTDLAIGTAKELLETICKSI